MADESLSQLGLPEHYEMVKMQPIPKRQLIFFYEEVETGRIIEMEEQEAGLLEKDINRVRKFRRYGCSDRSAMIEYMNNCGFKPGQLVPYTKAQEIMRECRRLELEAAKGKFRKPVYKEAVFDQSILNHKNARSIMRDLGADI